MLATALKWSGRIAALGLALLWGAFFVEHLREWFVDPVGERPPSWVWLAQVFHGVMVLGLLLMLRWERTGVLVTVVSTVAFFGWIGGSGFPYLALLNAIPVVLIVLSRVWTSTESSASGPA